MEQNFGTQRDVVQHLKLSTRWIRELVSQGVLPSPDESGKYDLDVCRESYIEHLRNLANRRSQADNGIAQQLEAEKLRKLKRENDIEESKVAPVALLTDALQKAGAIIVANLESLPLLIKRHWPEVTGDQITMVKKAIAECRNTIADMRIDFEE